MNPLDNLVPPEQLYLSEDQEEDFHRAYLLSRIRLLRESRERERRRRQAMALEQEVSSDSEVENLTKEVKSGKMDLTPADSTPQELVKLDP
jgi:membrane-bound lytic murein transglycosylase MltF